MGVILTHRSHIGIVRVLLGIVGLQASGGLVSIISPSSELKIVHHFFFMNSLFFKEYSFKISKLFPTGSTGPQRFSLGRIHLTMSEFGALNLVLVISPLSELGIPLHFFFLVSLFFKEHSIKFSKIFSTDSTGWHLVQPVHQVNLYGASGFGAQILLGSGP